MSCYYLVSSNNENDFFSQNILFFLVFCAHILLPLFNQNKDFLIFYSWNMFSFKGQRKAIDILCPTKETLLLRDKNKLATVAGVNTLSLLYKLDINHDKLSLFEIEKIKLLCESANIAVVKLNLNYYEYFILKKDFVITETLKL